jgi:uncharacterized coiled-coil protein SlyX
LFLIEEQSKIIKAQALLISKQSKEIANLKSSLKKLEQKQIRKTSKNSHLPPSKDLARDKIKKNQSPSREE